MRDHQAINKSRPSSLAEVTKWGETNKEIATRVSSSSRSCVRRDTARRAPFPAPLRVFRSGAARRGPLGRLCRTCGPRRLRSPSLICDRAGKAGRGGAAPLLTPDAAEACTSTDNGVRNEPSGGQPCEISGTVTRSHGARLRRRARLSSRRVLQKPRVLRASANCKETPKAPRQPAAPIRRRPPRCQPCAGATLAHRRRGASWRQAVATYNAKAHKEE